MENKNVLIAEFIGFKKHDEENYEATNEVFFIPTDVKYGEINSYGYIFSPDCMLFDSNWNWLMKVVEKIYSMNEYYVYKNETTFMFTEGGIELTTDIESVYDSVIEFIKWFNKDKK